MTKDEWVALALKNGAANAAVIDGSAVVLSASFRDVCAGNGCGNYGQCYMCPPDVGEIEALMARVRAYPRGLLYQTIAEIEDSFDIEGMFAAGYAHAQVSQRIQAEVALMSCKTILHLSCGGCRLCETCAKRTAQPCRYPDKALPSLESYGVDVYNTVLPTPMKYINGQNTVTYFGMVLFQEEITCQR